MHYLSLLPLSRAGKTMMVRCNMHASRTYRVHSLLPSSLSLLSYPPPHSTQPNTLTLDVEEDMPVEDLRQVVHSRTGFPVANFRLTFGLQTLHDGWPLSKFKIRKDVIVDIRPKV